MALTMGCGWTGLRWEMYDSTRPVSFDQRQTFRLADDSLDPLSHRPNDHHRTPKDAPLFRPETKGKGDGRLLRRLSSDPPQMAPDWLLRRVVRHRGPLWGLPGDHRRIREECARSRALHWHIGGPRGLRETQRRVAGMKPPTASSGRGTGRGA